MSINEISNMNKWMFTLNLVLVPMTIGLFVGFFYTNIQLGKIYLKYKQKKITTVKKSKNTKASKGGKK